MLLAHVRHIVGDVAYLGTVGRQRGERLLGAFEQLISREQNSAVKTVHCTTTAPSSLPPSLPPSKTTCCVHWLSVNWSTPAGHPAGLNGRRQRRSVDPFTAWMPQTQSQAASRTQSPAAQERQTAGPVHDWFSTVQGEKRCGSLVHSPPPPSFPPPEFDPQPMKAIGNTTTAQVHSLRDICRLYPR